MSWRRGRTLLAGLVASLSLTAGAALAHPVDNQNLPPTKARPDLREASVAGGIAQAMLTREGRFACCMQPACGMCRQNGAACPCAQNLLAGKGVCGECWEGWQAGKGLFPTVEPTQVRLGTYPAQDLEYQKEVVPSQATGLLAAERKALDNAKRTLFQEGRYACCVRPGCDSCARAGGCPCGANLAAGKGTCGECLSGWKGGHGAFAGISADEVKLEPLEAMTSGMAAMGHSASGGVPAGGSIVPPGAILGVSQRQAQAALAALDRAATALAQAQQAPSRSGLAAALSQARRELEEARAQVSRGLYSLDLTGRLQALETEATSAPAPGSDPARVAGQQQFAAALSALERAQSALVAGQQSPDPALRVASLARARQALAEARARVAGNRQALATVTGEPEREGSGPPPAGPPSSAVGEGSSPGR
jgi:hypothetical protein